MENHVETRGNPVSDSFSWGCDDLFIALTGMEQARRHCGPYPALSSSAKSWGSPSALWHINMAGMGHEYFDHLPIWGFPKMAVPSVYHPCLNGILHERNHPAIGDPPFMETPHFTGDFPVQRRNDLALLPRLQAPPGSDCKMKFLHSVENVPRFSAKTSGWGITPSGGKQTLDGYRWDDIMAIYIYINYIAIYIYIYIYLRNPNPQNT